MHSSTKGATEVASRGLPLFWRDGALRVRIVGHDAVPAFDATRAHTDAIPKGAWNGALVDSGSRDVVLHSSHCEPCGGAALSAVTHATSSGVVAAGREAGTRMRHLADGKEWLRKHCGKVYVYDGRSWLPLASPSAAACTPFDAVVHREPARGFEQVSTSRSGTFGIAPGSLWEHPVFIVINRALAAVQSVHTDIRMGTMYMGCMAGSARDYAKCVAQELMQSHAPGRTLLRRLKPHSDQQHVSAYTARIASIAAGGALLKDDGESANIRVVIDTGSSLLYVPAKWWDRVGGGLEAVRVRLQCEPHVCDDPDDMLTELRTCIHNDDGGDMYVTVNVAPRNMSMIPTHLPVPQDTWLLGAKALAGKHLLFYPGRKHTGSTAFVCMSN